MRQEELQELQSKISDASAFIRPLRTEIGRIVAGQEQLVDRVLLSLIANGHLLLEGVPGLAKTLLVKTVAQAMDGAFSRIQFTPDLLPSDVVGTTIYNQNDHTFSVK
ncbi:MAG: AAA family ATPase, partial [Lentisphaeria bacterium]|nr:AAA family ATPase [Lentisphaeria bacterium]